MHGFVYEAHNSSLKNNVSKIGTTTHLDGRMKDLAAHTGVLGQFDCWNYYIFENSEIAKNVEQEVHRKLTAEGARIQTNREFFDKTKFHFNDVVKEVSSALGAITLSKYHIEHMFQDFVLFVPGAYFVLDAGDVSLAAFDKVLGSCGELNWEFEFADHHIFKLATLPLGANYLEEPDKVYLKKYFRLPVYVIRAFVRWRIFDGVDDELAGRLKEFLNNMLDQYCDKEVELFGDARSSETMLGKINERIPDNFS